MSNRRGGNRIRGPQSALTDFLAANNISAAQIRDDYARRLDEARQQADDNGEGPSNAAASTEDADVAMAEAIAAAEEAVENTKKRKRNEEKAIEKIKKHKKSKKAKKGGDSDDDFEDIGYKKALPLPGQLSNCDICGKRFTVTPYTKEGPDGGFLCAHCGKQMTKDLKAEQKAKQKKPAGRKRRQAESNRLDGIAANKVKSLQQLCIEKAVQYHDDVEELGDMPQKLMDRLSAIFSKKRVMNSKTLKLFMRPDVEEIAIHDAAYLEVNDYIQMFAVSPSISKLVIRNACQFKDEAVEYMLEKCDKITYLQIYAGNLISNEMWLKIFKRYGGQLETLKLNWLDATFDDDIAADMVKLCPKLRRLKLKLCRRLGQTTIDAIATLKHLEHLSLQIASESSAESLINLIQARGPDLQTLSLEKFYELDATILASIHEHCTKLSKLRLSDNDLFTDASVSALFTDWANPALRVVDFNSTRDVDNNNPDGPEETVGLGNAGMKALMQHSGFALESLNIASCRHISLSTFNDIFDGQSTYPALENIDVSFCSRVDTRVIAGIFKSCQAIKKVIAFGCFDVQDVIVPREVVLIGVPKAQDAIEQFGIGPGMEDALSRMVSASA